MPTPIQGWNNLSILVSQSCYFPQLSRSIQIMISPNTMYFCMLLHASLYKLFWLVACFAKSKDMQMLKYSWNTAPTIPYQEPCWLELIEVVLKQHLECQRLYTSAAKQVKAITLCGFNGMHFAALGTCEVNDQRLKILRSCCLDFLVSNVLCVFHDYVSYLVREMP